MLENHEIANIFPLLGDHELDQLRRDIEEHGLREEIWLYEGKILDGRNRYLACALAGVKPDFRQYEGNDPVGFVVSLNLHRRHLNESQRGMVATNIARLKNGSNQYLPKEGAQICAPNIPSQDEAAQMLNVSRRTVQHARAVQDEGAPELIEQVVSGKVAVSTASEVATLPKEEQVEIVAKGEKAILEAAKKIRAEKAEKIRATRIEKIAEISAGNQELKTDQKYSVVYADPPWRYEHAVSVNREIENHYPTMELDDIKNLPVDQITTEDAILYLWVTSPKLEEGISVMNMWGFSYRSSFVWVKDKIGMGYHNRNQHEFLLVGVKGSIPTPAPSERVSSVIYGDIEEHSRKPEAVREMIEKWYAPLAKIELFCRSPKQGWSVWGNQAHAA